MGLNVAKEVAAMGRMTVPELRARYAEVFGEECRSRHKQLLVKRIAWRLQALTGGDLSERARMRDAGKCSPGVSYKLAFRRFLCGCALCVPKTPSRACGASDGSQRVLSATTR